MIAPSVQFFNKDWQPIGDEKKLASTLALIIRVLPHILRNGLSGKRLCVAHIMLWAANRRATRAEDRAYSLMGLFDVDMWMLYGQGKKTSHRFQPEGICTSSNQDIFPRGRGEDVRTVSILTNGSSFFADCSGTGLIDYDEFIQCLKKAFSIQVLPSIDQDRFGVFPVTNRGIQIWMFLSLHRDSGSVFQALLPCRRLGTPKNCQFGHV